MEVVVFVIIIAASLMIRTTKANFPQTSVKMDPSVTKEEENDKDKDG